MEKDTIVMKKTKLFSGENFMDKEGKKALIKAVGLQYQQNAFEMDELKELENGLSDCGISLKIVITPTKHIMGIEDLFPQIQIFLSHDIVQTIFLGIASNVIWDCIKVFLKSLRKIVKKKPFTRVSNGKVDTNANPNIHVNIGKSHVVLPMEIDDDKFEYFLDKFFETINKDIITEEKYVFYDVDKQILEYYSKNEVVAKSFKQWSEKSENKDN